MPRVCIGQFPVKRPDRVTYSKNYGNAITQEWVGPPSVMQGLAVQLRGIYETVEIENGDLTTRIRATSRAPQYGEVETPTVTFELQQSEQVVSLAQHPNYASLGSSELAFVDYAIDEKLNQAEFLVDYEDDTSVDQSLYSTASSLYLKRRRGTDSFRIYGWQFQRIVNVSVYYPTQINLSNHGRLWTTSQVNTYCGTLPNITLPTYTSTASQSAAGLEYRWFRNVSSVSLSNRGSFNLIEGWELALWDTSLYDAAT